MYANCLVTLLLKTDNFKIGYTDLLLLLSRNTGTCQTLLSSTCLFPVCKTRQIRSSIKNVKKKHKINWHYKASNSEAKDCKYSSFSFC